MLAKILGILKHIFKEPHQVGCDHDWFPGPGVCPETSYHIDHYVPVIRCEDGVRQTDIRHCHICGLREWQDPIDKKWRRLLSSNKSLCGRSIESLMNDIKN